eukprot:762595-Hanusia_phi.AAC.2
MESAAHNFNLSPTATPPKVVSAIQPDQMSCFAKWSSLDLFCLVVSCLIRPALVLHLPTWDLQVSTSFLLPVFVLPSLPNAAPALHLPLIVRSLSEDAHEAKERGNACYKARQYAEAVGYYEQAINLWGSEFLLGAKTTSSSRSTTAIGEGTDDLPPPPPPPTPPTPTPTPTPPPTPTPTPLPPPPPPPPPAVTDLVRRSAAYFGLKMFNESRTSASPPSLPPPHPLAETRSSAPSSTLRGRRDGIERGWRRR